MVKQVWKSTVGQEKGALTTLIVSIRIRRGRSVPCLLHLKDDICSALKHNNIELGY